MHIFIELSIIVLITTLVATLMRVLKQPLAVGYILSGIIVGPYFLNILHSTESIELFSKIGISILLFVVGLSLNPDAIKETGKVSLITGIGQVIFTSVIGFLIMRGLGYDQTSALYGAIALTFSSTIIILKLLSDKGDLQKLYGKIAIGFLLVQDIVATLILLVVSAGGAEGISSALGIVLVKGIIAIIALYIFSKRILPKLSTHLAGSQELLFLFSIAWGLGLASLFYYLGFSIEIGALIAGVTLSVSSYAPEIGSRMKPLRDFFVVLFFVLLGSQIILTNIGAQIGPALLLSLFILVGNPLIVFFLMNILGYRSRTGFMAGLTVAQISEFSLILMALGLSLGHVSRETVSLITLVGIATIAGSTYLIVYAEKIYTVIRPLLKVLEIRKPSHADTSDTDMSAEMIIFGYDRVGFDFVQAAKKITEKFLVVDFNPKSIAILKHKKIPHRYGDAGDVEFLGEIGLDEAKIIVSTIPDMETKLLILREHRKVSLNGVVLLTARTAKEARMLYDEGASYVVMPHHLGAHHAASLITTHKFSADKFRECKDEHLCAITEKEKEMGQDKDD
jgi:Kef-type K+ transport system membrane component KefB/Trk K+ transport system NAD-binding subunit